MLRPFLSLLCITAFAGCLNYSCTLIGCMSGLRVNFASEPTSTFRVVATSSDGSGTMTFECPDRATCAPFAYLEGYLPQETTITVTYEGRSSTTTVRPAYEATYPNGRRCGGSCNQGVATVPLP